MASAVSTFNFKISRSALAPGSTRQKPDASACRLIARTLILSYGKALAICLKTALPHLVLITYTGEEPQCGKIFSI